MVGSSPSAFALIQLCGETFPDHPIHNSSFPFLIPFYVSLICFCTTSNRYTYLYFLMFPQCSEQCLAHMRWLHTICQVMCRNVKKCQDRTGFIDSPSKYLVLWPLGQESLRRKGAGNDLWVVKKYWMIWTCPPYSINTNAQSSVLVNNHSNCSN